MKQIKKLLVVMVTLFTVVGCGGGHGGDDSDVDAPPDIDAPPDAPKSYAPCETCCDPINQTGCTAGQACYPRIVGGGPPSYCDTAGAAAPGEQCFDNHDCAPRSECINQRCAKLCLDVSECTLPGETKCFPVQDPFIYGVCS